VLIKVEKERSPNWTMEHHLKRMLDGKIMTLGLQLLSPDGIFQMAPMTHVVAIGSPEWQLRESHSLKGGRSVGAALPGQDISGVRLRKGRDSQHVVGVSVWQGAGMGGGHHVHHGHCQK
jgi:hypothetical protein